MTRQSLKERLASYLQRNYSQAWIPSGELQRVVAEKANYTPQNVGRRMRELENEGVVEVKYERNHAFYRFKSSETVKQMLAESLAWFETLPA